MNRECIRARDWLSAALALLWISGCGADHAGSTTKSNATDTPSAAAGTASSDSGAAPQTDAGDCGAGAFESTYAAIQKVVFDGRGCTNNMCHGAMKMGGLDLRADVSYQNLVEVKSNNSPLFRVMPGVPGESFLYNKLHAATEPGSVEVEGSPMPSGLPPLSADHLEAIHRWIEAGAPRDGSIGGSITGRSDAVAMLLGSCLPAATPIEIKPLEPPAADEGIQFTIGPARPDPDVGHYRSPLYRGWLGTFRHEELLRHVDCAAERVPVHTGFSHPQTWTQLHGRSA